MSERKKVDPLQFFVELKQCQDAHKYVEMWIHSKYFDFKNVHEMVKTIQKIPIDPEKIVLPIGIIQWMQRGKLHIFTLVTRQICEKLKYLIDLYNTGDKPIHVVDLGCGSGVNGLILQHALKREYEDVELTLVDNKSWQIETNVDIVVADIRRKSNFCKPDHFNIGFMCWLSGLPSIEPGYDLLFCIGEKPGDCTGWIESDANYTVDMDLSLSISSSIYLDTPMMNRDYIGIKASAVKKHRLLQIDSSCCDISEIVSKFYDTLESPEERKIREEKEAEAEAIRDEALEKREMERIENMELEEARDEAELSGWKDEDPYQ